MCLIGIIIVLSVCTVLVISVISGGNEKAQQLLSFHEWCRWWDSNPHGSPQRILNPSRLPFHHTGERSCDLSSISELRVKVKKKSGLDGNSAEHVEIPVARGAAGMLDMFIAVDFLLLLGNAGVVPGNLKREQRGKEQGADQQRHSEDLLCRWFSRTGIDYSTAM